MPSFGKRRVSGSTPGTGRRSSAGSKIAYTSIRSGDSTTGTEATSGNESTENTPGNGKKRGSISRALLPSSLAQKLLHDIPKPNKHESEFMGLVSTGNLSAAKEFLKGRGSLPEFNINKTNVDGFSALHMAVSIEDVDMVKLLFTEAEDEIQLFDAFFFAIKEGDTAIVKEFVNFEIQRSGVPTEDLGGNPIPKTDESQKEATRTAIRMLLESKNATINSEFDEDITPLMLAAHCGHYELIKYFFHTGERLEPIAGADEAQKYGELLTSYVRVHTFQALANPMYISFFCMEFVSVDPILESFQLITQLRKYAENEPEVRSEYEKLTSTLAEYARDLLGLCRNNFEVDLMLTQPAGFPENTGNKYPRLAMAVELSQKEFVTHYNSQTALLSEWTKGYEEWKDYKLPRRLFQFAVRTICLLPISFFLCIHCKCITAGRTLYQTLSAPVSCFLHDLASSIFFILLLIADNAVMYSLDLFDPNDKSPPRSSIWHLIVEFALMVFVIGQIVSTVTQIFYLGRKYFTQMWNVYEILIQVLFVTAFAFAFLAWTKAPPWEFILKGEFGTRKYWPDFEPLLVAEGFYIVGVILSFGRLFRMLHLSPKYGPLQIALSKMLRSIAKAFVLYLIVIFSFSAGMCMLYNGYDDKQEWHDRDPETGELRSVQSDAYTSFGSAIQTLFWGVFGMAGLDNTNIVKIHTKNAEGEEKTFHHFWNQTAGRILYAVFHIFATTVLLNTIVAMMTGSAEDIFSNMDMEWKFGRTKVWMYYANGMQYPVPFNTLAIFQHRCCCKKNLDLEFLNRRDRTNYSILVKDLIQRYFHAKESVGLDGPATRDHVSKLKEAVSHIKEIHKLVKNRRLIAGAVQRFIKLGKSQSIRSRSGDM